MILEMNRYRLFSQIHYPIIFLYSQLKAAFLSTYSENYFLIHSCETIVYVNNDLIEMKKILFEEN